MTNSTVWKIIVSAALALICIILVQAYWLINAYDLTKRAFEEKAHMSLLNVAEQMAQLNQVQLSSMDVVSQIADNYFVVNIRDAIDANSLEYYLKKEFESVSLPVDFEYGIYDCETNQMVYGNYVGLKEGRQMKSILPTYDEFVYYFGVRFPDRDGYILKNLWIPILFTAILILSIIFFAYATYGILKQRKLSELQKAFINNMTHEFKTPLTSIQISSKVLLDDVAVHSNERLQQYARIIGDQASRLTQQIERVLQIASMQKSDLNLKLDQLDLHETIRHIVSQLESRIAEEMVSITLNLTAQDTLIRADQLQLSNVIHGLVDNAIKYSDRMPTIAIRTIQEGRRISLLVADKGIGIAPNDLKQVGQQFYRVPNGDIHDAKGFGLGLHYIKGVVEKHGWDFQISSQLGEGTQVLILIETK